MKTKKKKKGVKISHKPHFLAAKKICTSEVQHAGYTLNGMKRIARNCSPTHWPISLSGLSQYYSLTQTQTQTQWHHHHHHHHSPSFLGPTYDLPIFFSHYFLSYSLPLLPFHLLTLESR